MKMRKLILFLCLFALLLCVPACTRSGRQAHCYLCQGIPHDEPCIVDLATGDIAVLSAGDYGKVAWSFSGNILVTGKNGESSKATIPAAEQEVNTVLFCDDCMALIETTPNTGYVLADLHDLGHIQLYSIAVDTTPVIRNYALSITATDNARLEIQTVTN